MDLYVIVLIPNLDLRKEIKVLKNEIKTNTGSKKALNSPAHITIQRPFRREVEFEEKLIHSLNVFASIQDLFTVTLAGFDCFEPRVIFVNVKKSKEIQKIHTELNSVLLDQLGFAHKEISLEIHPHITIANRDLSKRAFYKVWPTYKDRKFKAEFKVKSIFLLKHNGSSWDIFREFLFFK